MIKKLFAAAALAIACPLAGAVPIYADTVQSFTGGSGFGVYDASGGAYTGASGVGVFDSQAATMLDGAVLALGGASGAPGQIVMSFSAVSFYDGPGADIRLFDSVGVSEGFLLDISSDGLSFFNIGAFSGNMFQFCSAVSPCITDVDITGAGISSASYLRITANQSASVSGFPESYDLDAIEALNFTSTSAVPEPGTLAIFALGLLGLVSVRRHKSVAISRFNA